MKRCKRFLVTLLFIFSAGTLACEITDDTGTAIHLLKPAQRIISLAPDITETLFAIGAGSRIVGVVRGSDYPKAAQKILSIGSSSGIDLERIISLQPDLIITWDNNFLRQLAVLKQFHIPIYTTRPRRLADIPRIMQHLGCLTGNQPQANKQAENFSGRLASLSQQYSRQKSVTVFYQIGAYSLFTINKDSWINQMITLCGGHNIFADVKMIAPEVSWEAVVAANPDVIISDALGKPWQQRWQKWAQLTAIKRHFMFTINPDLVDRAGPRVLLGTMQLCQYLQRVRQGYLLA